MTALEKEVEKRHPWHGYGPIVSPCKACEKRAAGCHDRCEAYAAYKTKLAKRIEGKSRVTDADAVTIEAIRRIKKSQRKRRR